MDKNKRIRVDAKLLHRCQIEKGRGAMDALAFMIKMRFKYFRPIIYSTFRGHIVDWAKKFGISYSRFQNIMRNAKRLGLIRVTKNYDIELLPLRARKVGETNIYIELPGNVKEMKVTEISNTLSLFDLRNQIGLFQTQKHRHLSMPERVQNLTVGGGRVKKSFAFCSNHTLAEAMNVSDVTIIKYIKEALRRGLIYRKHNIERHPLPGFINLKEESDRLQDNGFLYIKKKTLIIQHPNFLAIMPLKGGRKHLSFCMANIPRHSKHSKCYFCHKTSSKNALPYNRNPYSDIEDIERNKEKESKRIENFQLTLQELYDRGAGALSR